MTSEQPSKVALPVAILAGGKSSRFGADKAQALLAGKSLLQHVHDQMTAQTTGPIAINAAPGSARLKDLAMISDELGPAFGPLAGIHAALHWAKTQDAPLVATVSVDTPFLPSDLLARLMEKGAPTYAMSADRKHPTIGVWRAADFNLLETAIRDGVRAAHAWIRLCSASPVSFEHERGMDPFFNINTREDLDVAEAYMHAS